MISLYAGSFDPITRGHEWVINNAPGELVIAVANNPTKKYMFDLNERCFLVREYILGYCASNVRVCTIGNNYLVDEADRLGVDYIIRGIRNTADFEFEKSYSNINRIISKKNIPHLFLIPPADLCDVSSSFVKALIGPEGWEKVVSRYVNSYVLKALNAKR